MTARGHGHALAEATRATGWGPYPFPGGVLIHNYRAFDDGSVELTADKLVHVHVMRPQYCTGPGKVLNVCECAAMASTVAWLGGLAFDAFPEAGGSSGSSGVQWGPVGSSGSHKRSRRAPRRRFVATRALGKVCPLPCTADVIRDIQPCAHALAADLLLDAPTDHRARTRLRDSSDADPVRLTLPDDTAAMSARVGNDTIRDRRLFVVRDGKLECATCRCVGALGSPGGYGRLDAATGA